jgi:hypothetical protein
MKRFAGSFSALLAISLAGCQSPSAQPFAGDVYLPLRSSIGAHQEAVTTGDGPNGAHIIFLNFDGATVSPPSGWQDNSATNESQITRGTATIPAFDASPYAPAFTKASAETAVANYFSQYYADFNVQVVTTRPSGVRYTMCLVGGSPNVLGIGGGAAGIAPLDCGNQNEPDITYAFSSVLDPSNTGSATESLKEIAVTAAQETAHSFGLGHTTDQNDIMYPQLTGTATGFAKGPQGLQNDGSGQCSSPSTTQDSHQMLLDVLGPSTGMPMTGPTPTVAFVTPTDGATVPLSFTITVAASEAGGSIAHVDITSSGQSLFSLTSAPYTKTVTAPQAGMYQLTATAYDANGNFGSATINFTADPNAPPQMTGCTHNSDCNSPLVCTNGMCQMPGTQPTGNCSSPCPSGQSCQPDGTCAPDMPMMPMPGQLGGACSDSQPCAGSGICATLDGKQFCTTECDPSSANACPSTLDCVAAGGSHYCEPKNNASGGCSAVPMGHAPIGFGAMLAPLCLLALAFVRRRRYSR